MECENCQTRQAEVTFTVIEDNEMKTLRLCAVCAAEKGLTDPSTPKLPLAGFLAQIGTEEPAGSSDSGLQPCPWCGTTPMDFRRTGRVGCPQCYVHFEVQLRSLLRRIHGSAQHAGKLYLSESSDIGDRLSQLANMRRRLRRAIETEDFEAAAELRDRIHELEAAG